MKCISFASDLEVYVCAYLCERRVCIVLFFARQMQRLDDCFCLFCFSPGGQWFPCCVFMVSASACSAAAWLWLGVLYGRLSMLMHVFVICLRVFAHYIVLYCCVFVRFSCRAAVSMLRRHGLRKCLFHSRPVCGLASCAVRLFVLVFVRVSMCSRIILYCYVFSRAL